MVLQIVIKLYGCLDKNTFQLFNYFLYLSEICKLEIEGTKHEIESSKQHNQRKLMKLKMLETRLHIGISLRSEESIS